MACFALSDKSLQHLQRLRDLAGNDKLIGLCVDSSEPLPRLQRWHAVGNVLLYQSLRL